MIVNFAHLAIWTIAVVATIGILTRPWKTAEYLWAVGAAFILVVSGLLPLENAARAVAKGTDVYFFLAGMMLLSELSRREALFDFLACWAVDQSRGSATRLFTLVYGIGALVTVFMSNDATAVVLTPAVFAVARKAGAKPLPYLFACAFIANAASFVLPISNPANLVIFGTQLPPLFSWLARFALPSLMAIVSTFIALRWLDRAALAGAIQITVPRSQLSRSGQIAGGGILSVAVVLLLASAFDIALGLPTAIASTLVAAVIFIYQRQAPWPCLRSIAWSVLPLVAGLFVIVAALESSGLLELLTVGLQAAAASSEQGTLFGASAVVAVICNLINNLPAGLIAGSVVAKAQCSTSIQSAIAIAIDLGPNLSITGSLATLLWLMAIRREGENVSHWQFLRYGMVVMPLALALALGGLWLQSVL